MPIPSANGWYAIPGTNTRAVAPPGNYPPGGGTWAQANNGLYAYSGGVLDTRRHILMPIGGGHQDYYGNELYAACDLTTLTSYRLTNPFSGWPPNYVNGSVETNADGTPGSRHTYCQLAYMPHVDKIYMQGGSLYGDGDGTLMLWIHDCRSRSWQGPLNLANKPNSGADTGSHAHYDRVTGYVFHRDATRLYRYDPLSGSTGAYTQLHDGQGITYTLGSALDPIRRKMLILGSGQCWIVDISGTGTYNAIALPLSGSGNWSSDILNTSYPGVAWHPVSGNFVCWNGGNSVYMVNLDNQTATPITYSGGPPRRAANGTFGRWQYSEYTETFVCVNHADDPVYSFRLSPADTPPTNRRVKFSRSASTTTNQPVSDGMQFAPGEIPQYAQAVVNGFPVTTQCDVKTRWPDGSVETCIVSYVMSTLPGNGSVSVTFQNQSTGNNTGGLTAVDMLGAGYDFDCVISITNPGGTVRTVSARAMLQAGNFEVWMTGPVCTSIILRDLSATRTWDLDFGNGNKQLHPRFEARFYPNGNRCWVRAVMENCKASTTLAGIDVTYSVSITKGVNAPAVWFTNAQFTHLWRTVWTKNTWMGSSQPTLVRHVPNASHMAASRLIPNLDRRQTASEAVLAGMYSSWTGSNKTLGGNATGIGLYAKDLENAGAAYWIGLLETWQMEYLFSEGDVRMEEVLLGQAELIGRIPDKFREADSLAGTGDFFDAAGSVPTLGKIISVNARRTVSLSQLNLVSCSGGALDQIADATGQDPSEPDGWQPGLAHTPPSPWLAYLITGQHHFYELILMKGAFCVAHKVGCVDSSNSGWRQGSAGYLNQNQVRGDAWGFRDVIYAWKAAVDGSAEKAYFLDKLKNNIAMWEGSHAVANSYSDKLSHWNFGNQFRIDPADTGFGGDGLPPAPFQFWKDRGPGFVQTPPDGPIVADGSILCAMSPWEESFLICAFGMGEQFGLLTGNLLTYMCRLPFNIMMNSQSLKYLIEAYRWPTKRTATGTWLNSFAQFSAGFATPLPSSYATPSGFNTTDHGRGYIANAALSYLSQKTADGYAGSDVWNKLFSEMPGQRALSDYSPKWSIQPLRLTVTSAPPTVPSAPLNLRRA